MTKCVALPGSIAATLAQRNDTYDLLSARRAPFYRIVILAHAREGYVGRTIIYMPSLHLVRVVETPGATRPFRPTGDARRQPRSPRSSA